MDRASLAWTPHQAPERHPSPTAPDHARMPDDQETLMSHVPAPESTPDDAQPESGPVSDRDAQDAREARFLSAVHSAYDTDTEVSTLEWDARVAHLAMQVADAERAPLVARVADLEAEVERVRVRHHKKCFQRRPGGVPEDLPADICDCGILWMLKGAAIGEARAEAAEAERDAVRHACEALLDSGQWENDVVVAFGRAIHLTEWCVTHSSRWPLAESRCAEGDPWDDGKECTPALAAAGPAVSDGPSQTDPKLDVRPNAPTLGAMSDGEGAASGADTDITDAIRHVDCVGDTGTSHVLHPRQYVVKCEWCPEVFFGPTKAEAMRKFRGHESERLDTGNQALAAKYAHRRPASPVVAPSATDEGGAK